MSSKKVLVVFGVTGNQGGSVIRSILKDPEAAEQYHLRAVTRDPSKPAAAALALRGVSVLKGDLNDKNSLRVAMKGAYAVFAVTNFHETMSKEVEMEQGKNIADIAKELDIQHLIWSSLPHVSKITNEKYTGVLHFDSKALVEEYIRELSIPYTAIQLGVFMPWILKMLTPLFSTTSPHKKAYKISLPIPSTTKWPVISVANDTGTYVVAILKNRGKLLGKQICAGEAEYTIDEMVKLFREKGGLDVVFEECSDAQFRSGLAAMGAPESYQEDMSQNMRYEAEYGFFGGVDLKTGQEILTGPLETFEEWILRSPETASLR